jgi:DNA-binding response OmpR family regulator
MANDPEMDMAADASRQVAAGVQGARVMVLLDDAANAELLCECLKDMSYRNAFTAAGPVLARQGVLNDRPDLLIVDAELAGEAGIDFLAWLRADRALKDLPVIMLSAVDSVAMRIRALELGAADYLRKPTDARELALRMRNTLAITMRRARLAEQDALTGLTNRLRFNTILDWAMTYARRMKVSGAVLQIGVDRFAQVKVRLAVAQTARTW